MTGFEQPPPKIFNKTSRAEKYFFRFERGCLWALFVIDEADGTLMIMSDYGNWSHFWGSHGRKSFKHFLCELDRPNDSYLISKLAGGDREFDWDRTKAWIRESILRYRREGGKKRKAKMMWDEFKELRQEYVRTENDFRDLMTAAPEIRDFFSDSGESPEVFSPPYHLTRFVREIYPHFTAELRKEIGDAGKGDIREDGHRDVSVPV